MDIEYNNNNKEEFKAKENSGLYFKDRGNEEFEKGNYEAAITNYSKAIEINDTESVFYSNRARCYKLIKDFEKANKDAVHAIELDDKNIKAHLLCGQTLVEIGKNQKGTDIIESAINKMTKALTLCAGQKKKHYEKELNKYILRAKKVLWYKKQIILNDKKREILAYIKGLIAKNPNIPQAEKEEKFNSIKEVMGDPDKELDFAIPDFLCCWLTKKLMDEPVTTQSGITYEKSELSNFLKSNGSIDPRTRDPINEKFIYPNLNIKQAIESFLNENPWAFEFKGKENYISIEF